MILTQKQLRALILLGGFGIVAPYLLLSLVLRTLHPAVWPISAKILDIGVALSALVSIVSPDLPGDGQ